MLLVNASLFFPFTTQCQLFGKWSSGWSYALCKYVMCIGSLTIKRGIWQCSFKWGWRFLTSVVGISSLLFGIWLHYNLYRYKQVLPPTFLEQHTDRKASFIINILCISFVRRFYAKACYTDSGSSHLISRSICSDSETWNLKTWISSEIHCFLCQLLLPYLGEILVTLCR